MTQEEKQLLLQDLCARLPYGVKVKTKDDFEIYTLLNVHPNKDIALIGLLFDDVYATAKIKIEDCKPYLRPMSSMTEEEKVEYCNLQDKFLCSSLYPVTDAYALFDWLNKKMFDYRGLIPLGSALEAPEGMYNN